jgi:ATP-dependent protease ClpP protease subunit
MRKWFQVKAQADLKASAEIFIYGDIGESWYEETTSAADFVRQLNDLKNEAIDIRINSVGGSVPDGLAIYNAIQRHPSTITIHIDGMAMSIASLIAMAADNVMSENAILMIHAPWSVAVGNAQEMRDMADTLDRWAEAMSTSYARKTGKSKEEVLALLQDGKDHYFTAEQAQAEGFVDLVAEAMPIAASLRVPANSVGRFENLPKSINQFTTVAATAPKQEEQTMTREEQIRAKFKAHLEKPGVQALLDKVLADESVTVAAAEQQLQGVLATAGTQPSAADILAKDKARREGIKACFSPAVLAHKGMDNLREKLLEDTNITPESAGLKILEKMGEGVEPVAGHIVVRENEERAKFQDGIVASLLSRAGKANQETRALAQSSDLRNFSLMEHAKASLTRAGVNHSSMTVPQIAIAALTQSTSDFPVLLENAMHKALLQSYQAAGDTWSRFCRTGSVSDFRAHGRYRTGTIGNYTVVNENGEYQNVAIPDGEKGSVTAVDRGLIINLTYQMIVNDDLGAFIGLASDLGRAGRRTVESAVYALIAENSGLGPTMLDGDTLFHANHGNIGTGAALTMASIDADRVLMGGQTDISGNEFLDLRPAIWLGPLGSGGTARTINDAQYDPDTANKLQKPNMVRGIFRDVVDTARLSGTRYYLFADPAEAPVIEVAFLNGETEPYLMLEEAFSSRGAKWRATLDFGVAAIDYRGAVTNAGVA